MGEMVLGFGFEMGEMVFGNGRNGFGKSSEMGEMVLDLGDMLPLVQE